MKVNQERRLADSVSASHAHKAAKVRPRVHVVHTWTHPFHHQPCMRRIPRFDI